MAQWLEHCVSSAKVVGSIPREHMYWPNKKCLTWMHCKSLWIKASAKCINVNVNVDLIRIWWAESSVFVPVKHDNPPDNSSLLTLSRAWTYWMSVELSHSHTHGLCVSFYRGGGGEREPVCCTSGEVIFHKTKDKLVLCLECVKLQNEMY